MMPTFSEEWRIHCALYIIIPLICDSIGIVSCRDHRHARWDEAACPEDHIENDTEVNSLL